MTVQVYEWREKAIRRKQSAKLPVSFDRIDSLESPKLIIYEPGEAITLEIQSIKIKSTLPYN